LGEGRKDSDEGRAGIEARERTAALDDLVAVEIRVSGIPGLPNEFGAYVMFEDTPYAHLMIYQDPMKMK